MGWRRRPSLPRRWRALQDQGLPIIEGSPEGLSAHDAAIRALGPPREENDLDRSAIVLHSRGRCVIEPHVLGSSFWVGVHTELRVVADDRPDEQVGAALAWALEAKHLLPPDSQGRQRTLALNRAFEAGTQREWLDMATCASVERHGAYVWIFPWRRYGKRDAWVGVSDDPSATAPLEDASALGAALREMLSLRLPAAAP